MFREDDNMVIFVDVFVIYLAVYIVIVLTIQWHILSPPGLLTRNEI